MTRGERSAGVVIVRFVEREPRYLLLRAYRYWDFPKGRIEPGEDPLDAARREAFEETGLSELVFRWGSVHQETPPYGKSKIARYYVAESIDGQPYLPVSTILGRPEHHEFRWVDYARATQLLVPRVRAVLEWADAVIRG
ncbi:MAG: NUDIX domain-containing protein [Halofilum sp. (in: g-proteobacteria)]